MSIDWATIKPLIKSQLATITGLDPSTVLYVDEPAGNMAGKLPVIWLRINSPVGEGVDYEKRTSNGSADVTVTVVGQRLFTLNVRVESFTPDISDERHAANITEQIRTRLKRSTSVTARAGAFAVQEILMSKKVEYLESNRPVTTYLLDVLCRTANYDVDTTDGAGGWIGEVQGSGTVKDNDGSTVDTPTFDSANAV